MLCDKRSPLSLKEVAVIRTEENVARPFTNFAERFPSQRTAKQEPSGGVFNGPEQQEGLQNCFPSSQGFSFCFGVGTEQYWSSRTPFVVINNTTSSRV